MSESYELLRQAYAIIDGVPDKVLDLSYWVHRRVNFERPCNTLGCAAGLLAQHPDMMQQGLYLDGGGRPTCQGYIDFFALSKFFGLDCVESEALFGGRWGVKRYDPLLAFTLSDRQLWLCRVKNFLETKNA